MAKSTAKTSGDRKSTRLNSSHRCISYAVFCLKKKNNWYVTSGSLPFGLYLNGDGSNMGTPYIEDTYDFTIQLYAYFGNSASQFLFFLMSRQPLLSPPFLSAPLLC